MLGIYLKENYSGPLLIDDDCVYTMNHASQFNFHTFSPNNVLEALQAIDTRSSTGEDKLDSFFLKLSTPIFTKQLMHIFNLSISAGRFLSVWK